MVSAQFLLVASLTTLFWAPRALLANLKCKKTIVERTTFTQANQAACCARTLIFEIFDLFSHSFDLSLSLRYFSWNKWALSSLSQKHLCCLYLLHKISRLLTETSFSFQPSQPGSLQALGGGDCPCEDMWVLVPGPWPPDLFFLFILFGCLPLSSWKNYALKLSIFLLERKKFQLILE